MKTHEWAKIEAESAQEEKAGWIIGDCCVGECTPVEDTQRDIKRNYKKTVELVNGVGTVTFSVSVNPFELKGKTRTWLFELIDKLNECPTED